MHNVSFSVLVAGIGRVEFLGDIDRNVCCAASRMPAMGYGRHRLGLLRGAARHDGLLLVEFLDDDLSCRSGAARLNSPGAATCSCTNNIGNRAWRRNVELHIFS